MIDQQVCDTLGLGSDTQIPAEHQVVLGCNEILTSLLNVSVVLLFLNNCLRDLIKKKIKCSTLSEFLCEQRCVMMVRCSSSLWKHTGGHNTVSRRQTGDRKQQCTSDDEECPGTPALSVINSRQCLSSSHTDCLNACNDHSLTRAQASRL